MGLLGSLFGGSKSSSTAEQFGITEDSRLGVEGDNPFITQVEANQSPNAINTGGPVDNIATSSGQFATANSVDSGGFGVALSNHSNLSINESENLSAGGDLSLVRDLGPNAVSVLSMGFGEIADQFQRNSDFLSQSNNNALAIQTQSLDFIESVSGQFDSILDRTTRSIVDAQLNTTNNFKQLVSAVDELKDVPNVDKTNEILIGIGVFVVGFIALKKVI